MADSKISNLPAASTPLAGTEVLPVVQGGVTTKVSIANVTAGRAMAALSGTFNPGTYAAFPAITVAATSETGRNYQMGMVSGGKWALYENLGAVNVLEATPAGDVGVPVGNLVIGTSGKGIDFSAASHAAGMTSELLADYEEGTWTPTLNFSGGSTGITYDGDTNGIYTKVGNVVSFSLRIGLTSKGSSVGSAVVAGFPFTAAASPASANVPLTFFNIGITFTGTVQLYISAGATNAAITEATAVGSFGAITNTNFSNTSTLLVSGTYRAA